MAWGLIRFHKSGQNHFVTFCCYHRRQLFTTHASRRIFESALERVRRSYGLCVYGYVVMPEHVHLLLSEPRHDTRYSLLQRLQHIGQSEWTARKRERAAGTPLSCG